MNFVFYGKLNITKSPRSAFTIVKWECIFAQANIAKLNERLQNVRRL